MRYPLSISAAALLAFAACTPATSTGRTETTLRSQPTLAEAEAFMTEAESRLYDLGVKASRASWVSNNFITHDTELITSDALKDYSIAVQRYAMDARRYDDLDKSPELRRKFMLLKLALSAPPPSDTVEAAELTRIGVTLRSDYGRGSWCRPAPQGGGEQCLQINELSRILAQSRDPAELLNVWVGWRTISPPMRERYARFVELSNKGARELGFTDAGAMWRAGYDMPADEFARELDRLWEQVRPLYLSLHAYVRAKLGERYGTTVVPPEGMIPAHLLGNMWAQAWSNVYPLVAPSGPGRPYDLTDLLKQNDVDAVEMARYGERFFSSLGFEPLPQTFWERSLFTRPRDREVVCHASAWNIDDRDDVRIKMCIEITGEDFVVVHHELGHNYYQRAYKDQPFFFRGGAHDGFHEAIGDAIALSITPEYLNRVELLDQVPGPEGDLGLLLGEALGKVAFLPFGLLVDQWRWKVFSGEVTPANYNAAWWELRNRYQGVSAPMARTEAHFDPGAKFHVPANTPYTRYFLAHILQFQFHRALCREAGHTGPLHRCSIYGSREAGAKLARMLEAGQSRPWQEILYELTGERQMDATAIVDYFAPLKAWLDEQNAGRRLGWEHAANGS